MVGLISFGTDGAASTLDAIGKALAIIEFEPTGEIRWANENFCRVLGYRLDEIKGRHHSLFVEPTFAQSNEYSAFWAKLGRGEFESREFKRIGKGGAEIWIQASYNPVVSRNGRVTRVVKVATDITEAKLKAADDAGKIAAIGRAQAVIEFTTDGTVVTANENFLSTLGYKLDEIKGQHHRIFVDPVYANSPDYARFWERLRGGEFIAQEFQRIGKGGKQIWIQASYNPIFDMSGNVRTIVKFATDVTERVRAVETLAEGMGHLATGDLRQEITSPFPPALEKLRVDFNKSVSSLRSTMSSVSEISQAMDGGTQEISSASDDLSRRTEQNAASLEETAAALDEITATVGKTADGAKEANAVVATAKSDADRGGTVVRQAVEAMSKIEKSSQQIGQIIGVIDEIAFQTNLLALNAGVEAARAGDAGRGFAVVASEVRALAQRSADAAKEIKGLISTSTSQVGDGVKLVAETGEALARIVTKVTEINLVVTEIAASAQTQATGLQQVNAAVNQMDQVTQQNAAMAEEATAASQSLAEKSSQLARLIAQFQVGSAKVDPIRTELKKVAPHAFRSTTSVSARTASGVVPRLAAQAGRHEAMKGRRVAAAGGQSDGWEEF